jgi:hypothetical protein
MSKSSQTVVVLYCSPGHKIRSDLATCLSQAFFLLWPDVTALAARTGITGGVVGTMA